MTTKKEQYIHKIHSVKARAYERELFASGDWRNEFAFDLWLSFDKIDDYVEEALDLMDIVYRDPKSDTCFSMSIADKHIDEDRQCVYLLIYPTEPKQLRFTGLFREKRDFYFILFDGWSAFRQCNKGEAAGRLRGKILLGDMLQLSERNGQPASSLLANETVNEEQNEIPGIKRIYALLTLIHFKNKYNRFFSRPVKATIDILKQPYIIAKFLMSYISPRYRSYTHSRMLRALLPSTAVVEYDNDGYWLYLMPNFLSGGFLRVKDANALRIVFGVGLADTFVDDGFLRYGISGTPQICEEGNFLGRFPIRIPLKLVGPSTVDPEPGDVAIGIDQYWGTYWWEYGILRYATPEKIPQLEMRKKLKGRTFKYGKRFPHIDRGQSYKNDGEEN